MNWTSILILSSLLGAMTFTPATFANTAVSLRPVSRPDLRILNAKIEFPGESIRKTMTLEPETAYVFQARLLGFENKQNYDLKDAFQLAISNDSGTKILSQGIRRAYFYSDKSQTVNVIARFIGENTGIVELGVRKLNYGGKKEMTVPELGSWRSVNGQMGEVIDILPPTSQSDAIPIRLQFLDRYFHAEVYLVKPGGNRIFLPRVTDNSCQDPACVSPSGAVASFVLDPGEYLEVVMKTPGFFILHHPEPFQPVEQQAVAQPTFEELIPEDYQLFEDRTDNFGRRELSLNIEEIDRIYEIYFDSDERTEIQVIDPDGRFSVHRPIPGKGEQFRLRISEVGEYRFSLFSPAGNVGFKVYAESELIEKIVAIETADIFDPYLAESSNGKDSDSDKLEQPYQTLDLQSEDQSEERPMLDLSEVYDSETDSFDYSKLQGDEKQSQETDDDELTDTFSYSSISIRDGYKEVTGYIHANGRVSVSIDLPEGYEYSLYVTSLLDLKISYWNSPIPPYGSGTGSDQQYLLWSPDQRVSDKKLFVESLYIGERSGPTQINIDNKEQVRSGEFTLHVTPLLVDLIKPKLDLTFDHSDQGPR